MKTKEKEIPYINIGPNFSVKKDDIVGIFDLDKITVFKVNRNYLSNSEKSGKIITVSEDLPKSCVLCYESENKSEKIYLSPLLSSTLFKRNTSKVWE